MCGWQIVTNHNDTEGWMLSCLHD